ncbi:MAG: flagellar hook-basal body complex protein FliE [Woeseiaceae bacterium]
MNEISSANMLAKIREMNAQIEGGPVTTKEATGVDFSALLNQSLSKVNELQTTGAAKAAAFEAGAPDADLTQVMVSLQKASLSFQAMTEVRNKLVNAYQEVMNMPV